MNWPKSFPGRHGGGVGEKLRKRGWGGWGHTPFLWGGGRLAGLGVGRVLIVHFRVGRTDGVSLEIANWKAILESEGWEVAVCSGPESEGADYVIEDLEPQLNRKIFELDEAAFGGSDSEDEDSFARRFGQIQSSLRAEFEKVVNKVKPVRVIAANGFSVGVNVAAAGALAEGLKTKGVL